MRRNGGCDRLVGQVPSNRQHARQRIAECEEGDQHARDAAAGDVAGGEKHSGAHLRFQFRCGTVRLFFAQTVNGISRHSADEIGADDESGR